MTGVPVLHCPPPLVAGELLLPAVPPACSDQALCVVPFFVACFVLQCDSPFSSLFELFPAPKMDRLLCEVEPKISLRLLAQKCLLHSLPSLSVGASVCEGLLQPQVCVHSTHAGTL